MLIAPKRLKLRTSNLTHVFPGTIRTWHPQIFPKRGVFKNLLGGDMHSHERLLVSIFCLMWLSIKEINQRVINVVWQVQPCKFSKKGAVSDRVEGLAEIKGYDYYVWVSREQVRDFVEKSYDSCCSRTRRSNSCFIARFPCDSTAFLFDWRCLAAFRRYSRSSREVVRYRAEILMFLGHFTLNSVLFLSAQVQNLLIYLYGKRHYIHSIHR